MRLKLVLLVSLVGAVIGSGIPVAILVSIHRSMARATDNAIINHVTARGDLIYLVPFAFSILSGIFIYRHTSRWRKSQSLATAILVLLLSWVALIASIFFL